MIEEAVHLSNNLPLDENGDSFIERALISSQLKPDLRWLIK